jgi:hypothetical protein
MAEAPSTPGATLRGSGGSVLSSTNGGSYRHIEEDPGPNPSTRSAIIYKTSPTAKPEQPSSSRLSSGSRKSKSVSFHSATSLPTERKISSGKLQLSPSCARIMLSCYFAERLVDWMFLWCIWAWMLSFCRLFNGNLSTISYIYFDHESEENCLMRFFMICTLNIIRTMNSQSMRWTGRVAIIGM